MKTKSSCNCSYSGECTIFACSGAADLGHVSDLVARKMHQNKVSNMKCLAFVSAGISDMIDSIRNTNMMVIDGCALDCGKKTFEKNGLNNFVHFRLTDLGYEKGKTPATQEVVDKIYEQAIALI